MRWTAVFVAVVPLGCGETTGTWDRGVGDTPPSSSGAGRAGSEGGGEGGAGPGDTYGIDPSALAGCRAPNEAGCAECCVADNERCSHFTMSGGVPGDHYTAVDSKEGACPPTCNPCATCMPDAEASIRRTLNELASRPECDCESVRVVFDACIVPDSCECLCTALQLEVKACPPSP